MSDLGNKKIMALNIKRLLALSDKSQKEICKDFVKNTGIPSNRHKKVLSF